MPQRRCPQTTTFEERGEPKRNRTEVLLLTSLTPYLWAKPALSNHIVSDSVSLIYIHSVKTKQSTKQNKQQNKENKEEEKEEEEKERKKEEQEQEEQEQEQE